VSVAIKFTDSMHDVLDWFDSQPCDCATVARIAAGTDWSRETVRNNLKQLAAADAAENVFETTGEYRLVYDPREECNGAE